jgi:hypothetical protein
VLTFAGCGTAPQPTRGATNDGRPTTNSWSAVAEPWFVDVAAESGLTLRHVNGMSGKFHYAEVIAPGAALFDYDNDGDLDAYLVQGGPLDGADARTPGLHGRLFRNDLTAEAGGARTVRYVDVTDTSGLDARGYGMGAAPLFI